jgi:glycosyltransferase involved in cell wall biosynthesis
MAYLLHGGTSYRAAGVSRYSYELLRHLPGVRPDYRYVAFVGQDAPPLEGVLERRPPLPTSNPLARITWEQVGLSVDPAARRVDLLHGTVNVIPLLYRGPTVVTVHDLSFVRVPDRLRRAKVHYLRTAVALSLLRATRVIAVSNHTRQDLLDWLHLPEENVSVVHSGVDPAFRPLPPCEVQRFREQTLDGHPYILHVGTLEPRKNLDVLIRAFAAARREAELPHLLVLVGASGWMDGHLREIVRDLGVAEVVRFIGYVERTDLPLWYNGADLFAYPSAYEGFGLPVLEAMACGVPTIASSASALVEVAGGACLTVVPGSQEELQHAIVRLLGDGELHERLRQAGLFRAAAFSWDRTASATVEVYEQAIGAARR